MECALLRRNILPFKDLYTGTIMATTCQPESKRTPLDLFQTYIRYKQDTRAVVKWLVDYGSVGTTSKQRFQIGDLVGMAYNIRAKGVEVPDVIGFHLKEAIRARVQLSRFFTKTHHSDDEIHDTAKHEFFTARLVPSLIVLDDGLTIEV